VISKKKKKEKKREELPKFFDIDIITYVVSKMDVVYRKPLFI